MKTLRVRIIAGLVAIAFLVALAFALFTVINTKRLFADYLNEYRITRQVQWARVLAEHYLQRGSWQGVNQILPGSRENGSMGMMRGRRVTSGEMIVLAGPNGDILAATDRFDSQSLNGDELQQASAIQIDEKIIGYVYLKVEYEIPGLATMESQFLRSVYYSSIGGGILVAIIAALIGISFSNRLIHPLKQLTDSAKKITKGEWEVKVNLDRDDEVGELAQAFNVMTEKLRETEMARKTLVADVAHELRNPLATLRAQLESIQEGVTKPETQVILSLNDEVIRLSKLVNDLQDLSLAEVGKLSLNKENARLDLLLQKVVGLFEGSIQDKEIELSITVPELPQISMDSQRMTQVIINLLGNAIRHTPFGQKISISGGEKAREIYVEIFNEGESISIKDLPYIFNRFYRADKGRAREQGGSGLGLAITKSLIEAHGGTIGVLNDYKGVKFFFILPK
ncbi:MAG: hypothetical protein APF76_03215 [Desulfitibacter sp. BRH_c19]|nr:MAG: hypothetical protein APF76_03215 [Desulfitibacter sp. BRH_c19]